jgi:hypothetical protein
MTKVIPNPTVIVMALCRMISSIFVTVAKRAGINNVNIVSTTKSDKKGMMACIFQYLLFTICFSQLTYSFEEACYSYMKICKNLYGY